MSRWMAAFWVGLTAFAILWLASAPSTSEFVLRSGVLVAAAALYWVLIRGRHDDEPEGVPARVLVMLVALAGLAVVGILYYSGTLEKITSGILALTVSMIVIENLKRP